MPTSKVFIEEVKELGYNDTYRVDKKPDRDSYTFSALNKKHLSRYKQMSKVCLSVHIWCVFDGFVYGIFKIW